MRFLYSLAFLVLLAVGFWFITPESPQPGYREGAAVGYPLIPWLIGTIVLFVLTRKRPAKGSDYMISAFVVLGLLAIALFGRTLGQAT